MSGRSSATTLIVRSIKFPPHGPGSQCPVFIKNVVHTKLCKFFSPSAHRLLTHAAGWRPLPLYLECSKIRFAPGTKVVAVVLGWAGLGWAGVHLWRVLLRAGDCRAPAARRGPESRHRAPPPPGPRPPELGHWGGRNIAR